MLTTLGFEEDLMAFADGGRLVRTIGEKDEYCIKLHGIAHTHAEVLQHFKSRSRPAIAWQSLLDLGQQVTFQSRNSPFKVAFAALNYDREDQWLSLAAAIMIAEERGTFYGMPSKTGCSVMLVAFHQVLFDGADPIEAAVWSKGRRSGEILDEARRRFGWSRWAW